ncbi:hypothetical protein BGZ73_001838 [Actinomortierella ambigua]|nr:hypothetical protein BGZ73_001838 [Actinomortierella ambigua]
MTTADALRDQLAKLGLDTSGLKQTLKLRLRAFKKKHPEAFQKSSDAQGHTDHSHAETASDRDVESNAACDEQPQLTEEPLHPNSRFDYYLCFDVEATCEHGHSFTFPNEVIEFPIVLLDGKTFEVVDEFHSYVKPTFRPILSDFCTELTGIQQETIDDAPTFVEVLEQFEQWMVKHKIFVNLEDEESILPSLLDPKKKRKMSSPAVRPITSISGCRTNPEYSYCFVTDGPFDIRDFIGKQCLHSGISRPFYFTKAFLDIRTKFRDFFDLNRWLNLEGMLTFLGETFEGRQHSGICDARMVGLITRRLAQGFKADDLKRMGAGITRSAALGSSSWNVDKLAVGCVLKPNQKLKTGKKEQFKMTPFQDLSPVVVRAIAPAAVDLTVQSEETVAKVNEETQDETTLISPALVVALALSAGVFSEAKQQNGGVRESTDPIKARLSTDGKLQATLSGLTSGFHKMLGVEYRPDNEVPPSDADEDEVSASNIEQQETQPACGTTTSANTDCLLFQDEFDRLDNSVWKHDITMSGGGNFEFQLYHNNRTNTFVKDGVLYIKPTLTSDRIDLRLSSGGTLDMWGGDPGTACTANYNYGCFRVAGGGGNILNPVQSGMVRTVNSFKFRYGKVVVRARMPKGDWLWPAIWMLPADYQYGNWPASGEIDIVESRGNGPDYAGGGVNKIGSTLHWGPSWDMNRWPLTHQEYTLPNGKLFSDDFHTFTLDWRPTGLTTYVDDHKVLDVRFDNMFSKGSFPSWVQNLWEGSDAAPFDQEFYLLMNVAVGGTAGYFPDGVGNKPWSDTSAHAVNEFYAAKDHWYPTWGDQNDNSRAMAIDYVRVTASAVIDANNNNILALLHSLSVEQLERFEQSLRVIKEQKLAGRTAPQYHDTTAVAAISNPAPTPSPPASVIPEPQTSNVEKVHNIPWLTFTHKVKQQERQFRIRIDIERVTTADIADEAFRTTNCIYPKANGPEVQDRGARKLFEQECNEQGWKLAFLNRDILEGNKAMIQKAVVCFRNSSTTSRSRRAFRKDKIASGLFRKHLNPRKSKSAVAPVVGDSSLSMAAQGSHSERSFIEWQPTRNLVTPPNASSSASLSASNPAFGPTVWITHKNSLHSCEVTVHPSTHSRSGTLEQSPSSMPPSVNHQSTTPPLAGVPTVFAFDARYAGRIERLELISDIDHIMVDTLPADFKSVNSVFPRAYITEDADVDEATIQWAMFGIRQAEESLLNEIGWKLCWVNRDKLAGKKLVLQQALDAYRRKFLPETFQPRRRIESLRQSKAWLPARDGALDSPTLTEGTKGSPLAQLLLGARNSASEEEDEEDEVTELHGHPDGQKTRPKPTGFLSAATSPTLENQREGSAGPYPSSTNKDTGLSDSEYEEDAGNEASSRAESGGSVQGESEKEEEEEEEEEGYPEMTHPSVLEEIDRFLNEGSESDESSDDDSQSDGGEHSQMSLLSITGRIRTYSLGTGSGSARSRPVDRTRLQRRDHSLQSRLSTSFQSSGVPQPAKGRRASGSTSLAHLMDEHDPPLSFKRPRVEVDQTEFYDDWARLYEKAQDEDEEDEDEEDEDSDPGAVT